MERQQELLAGTIWRRGTRIQTGWWFASLGRILEAQDELDEEQIIVLCGQSRPLHDRQGQQIVFRLHAGKHLGAKTPEERRKWVVTLLTAFRIEWSNSLQRREDMVSQGKEEILDIGNLVTERYKRACRRHEANQVARRRARLQTADDRGGAEGPATVQEPGTRGGEESGQASGTRAEDPAMEVSQPACHRENETPQGRRAENPCAEAPEPSMAPQERHRRSRNWRLGDVVILQRPTTSRPQDDSQAVQRSGGGRPPWEERRRTHPPQQTRTRTEEWAGWQESTAYRTWTDRSRETYNSQNRWTQGWRASATTSSWRSNWESPPRRRRRYGDGTDDIRLAVRVRVSMWLSQPPWAGVDGDGVRVPLWQYPGQGDDAHTVSDGESSEEGDGRHGKCAVCYARNATRILWDCGHIITCGKCIRELFRLGRLNGVRVTCPQCRKRVWDTRRAFPVSLGTEHA